MRKYTSFLAIADYREFEWDIMHQIENFCMFRILSHDKLMKVIYMNINFTNEEQKIFDLERELILNKISPSDCVLYINRVTGLSYKRINFLLDRVELKCYLRGVLLQIEPIPPRKIKNIYNNYFVSNKHFISDYKGS